jgi:CheY-like chemotaxis protein
MTQDHPTPTSPGPRRRILVVEDEPVINDSVTRRLEAEGYEVTQAWDGPGAVAAVARIAPDLVLLDLMLPGYDGLEVCRRIQRDLPVPVLMLTATSSPDLPSGPTTTSPSRSGCGNSSRGWRRCCAGSSAPPN